MAGVRELKKHLKSIKTTGQLAGAMRTVSVAKYSKINARLSEYKVYAKSCSDMFLRLGISVKREEYAGKKQDILVVFSGNRGLCGGFNMENLAYFLDIYNAYDEKPLVVTVGKKAQEYCLEKKIDVAKSFVFSDVPSYGETDEVSEWLLELYMSGKTDSIRLIYQSFINMLKQVPVDKNIVNFYSEGHVSEDGMLFIPDAECVREAPFAMYFRSVFYSASLESAAGAQAATVIAMRSAYDNAKKSEFELETAINRRRQAEVTSGVLELSVEETEQY